MADESVVVELLMNASQFLSEAQRAAKATGEVGKAGQKSSQQAASGMDRMRQSARENSAEWKDVGGHLLKVGAAQVAFGAAVAVTGGNYNRLQQTSRAALSSMLGGTREANLQMDRLDAWATKSPFSRAVWIEAQQQLLAFGVEANRVIPYMDGIQNAVAAAGGSEAHLRGITEIMAKISSSSKITGQDLNQFGNWGVNAAELIGLAMGKTGAQIREEITAGTLDANVALDALALGMGTKFNGAAAAVKNTFDGAFDRVKAAFRDVSAEIMQPFIGKEGGGLFTSWLNGAADMLRAFQRLPGPVKDFAAAFGVATTALSLGGGAFLTMVPRVLELHRSLTILGSQGIPVVSRFAAAWAGVPGQLKGAFDDMRGGFRSIGDSMTLASQMGVSKAQAMRVGMMSAFQGIGSGAKGLGSALLGAFGGPWGLAATAAITGITMAVTHFSRQSQEAKRRAKELADTFDETTGQMTQATRAYAADQFVKFANDLKQVGSSAREATDAYMRGLPAYDAYVERTLKAAAASGMSLHYQARLADHLRDRRQDLVNATQYTQDYADAMGEGAEGADELRASVDGAADGLGGLADAAQEAADAQGRYLDSLKSVVDFERNRMNAARDLISAESSWHETLEKSNKTLAENGTSLDQSTEAGRENYSALLDLAGAATTWLDAQVAAVDANGKALTTEKGLAVAYQERHQQVSQMAEAMGYEADAASALATELMGTEGDWIARLIAEDHARAEVRETNELYESVPDEVKTHINAFGDEAIEVAGLVTQAIEGGVPMEKITALLADGSNATEVADAVQREIDAVQQRKAASIKAVNDANDMAREAQVVIDRVRQKTPAEIKAVDKASGILSSIKRGMDLITSKTVTVTTQHVVAGGAGGNSGMYAVGRAYGGAVFGPGGPREDLIPAWLSNNEHVVTAYEVDRLGGHQNMEALRYMLRTTPEQVRAALGFADGGSPATYSAYVPARGPAPVVNVAPMDLDGLRLVGDFRVNGQAATATDLRLERVSRGLTRLGDTARMQRR